MRCIMNNAKSKSGWNTPSINKMVHTRLLVINYAQVVEVAGTALLLMHSVSQHFRSYITNMSYEKCSNGIIKQ